MTVTRPALRYYGGKWKLAPWIISHFPAHRSYVEPCGGAASVLIRKQKSAVETYNDLDGNVVNFFSVLRDNPDELARAISLTPWARAEYDLAFWHSNEGTPLERARRFFVAQWMGINASTERSAATYGFRVQSSTFDQRIANDIDYMHSDAIAKLSERLRYVQIENIPAIDVIQKYDTPDTLHYFDPPYVVTEQRTKENWYALDWQDQDHRQAAATLLEAQGMVVISGYACPLYKELFEDNGYHRIDKQARGQQNVSRTESLWLSPRTHDALYGTKAKGVQKPLW